MKRQTAKCTSFKEYKFEPIHFSDALQYVDIIQKFNNSRDASEKLSLVNKLPIDILPTCRICNKKICNNNFLIKVTKTTIQLWQPSVYCREVDGTKYYLSCCEECLKKKFDNLPSSKYYFMKANKYGAYSYGMTDEDYRKICAMTTAVTLDSLCNKYGEDEGKIRWKQYCDKQALTNSFEYKQQKYGWTKEQFDLFNKSRAVTLDNLILKYGEDEGNKRWNDYVNQQKLTKSYEYMVDTYGEEHANKVNKSKAITLTNFINKYGEKLGTEKYNEIMNRMPKFYSKISQECFDKIDKYISKLYKTYYATKNTEYGVNLGDQYICLDYFIKDLNICIEFNGTHFHADPRIYKGDDKPNPYNKDVTAQSIWENDELRYKKLKEHDIETIVIWENDYKENFNVVEFIDKKLHIKLDKPIS